jgi:hypothetical protein
MKLSITIKPAKYTSTSRSQILKDILSGKSHTIAGIPVDIQGSYIVYSIQKIRGHWEYTYYKNGNVKSGKYVPTSYVGYKYVVPPSLLVMTGMNIKSTKTGYKLVKVK